MFALIGGNSKSYQRNILHKDKPYLRAKISQALSQSSPTSRERRMVVLTLYRISRDSRSSSCFLSGVGIAEAAAVFPVAIPIACKFLSAVLTGQCIKGLLVHLILVAVPVGHTTAVIAVPLFLASRFLFHGSAAMLTQH